VTQFGHPKLSDLLKRQQMKLIGYAFCSGRIDFIRKDNPWAFKRIDAGMKKSQADRIRLEPSKAPIELRSAPVNGDEVPEWMARLERILKSADSMYLQYKAGVLRFRMAEHDAGKHRHFMTLGNQDEFTLYAKENWQNLRYMYAERGINERGFCFDVQTLITHRVNAAPIEQSVEINARMEANVDPVTPKIIVDATGANASVDIIEWRGKVKEGEIGRYSLDDHRIEFSVRDVVRPFTMLKENRTEFNSLSYSFNEDKIGKLLDRVVDKRLQALEKEKAASDSDGDFDLA